MTSLVHSAMKDSCLCCLGVQGSETPVEGRQQWLVVSPQLELAALQSKPEVADGLEGGQELSVKGRILTFSC